MKKQAYSSILLMLSVLVSACVAVPENLDPPLSVNGIVKHWITGQEIGNVKLDFSWTGSDFPAPIPWRHQATVAETMTDNHGRFELEIKKGPPTVLYATTSDYLYSGSLNLNSEKSLNNLVVKMKPQLMGRWSGSPEMFDKYKEIVQRMVSGHIPGTPLVKESLQSLVDSGRIADDDLEFLMEYKHLFSGPWSQGNVIEHYRVTWGFNELEYGSRTDEIKFLTPDEVRTRNVRVFGHLGPE